MVLIKLLEHNISIKIAARHAGLKYENAKVIDRGYRKEGRQTKKVKRRRHDANLKELNSPNETSNSDEAATTSPVVGTIVLKDYTKL